MKTEKRPLLSICMIVKNEEANLLRCLDSLLPLINWRDDETLERMTELVVVDTGSTDRTVNVAKRYTERVYKKTFVPWDFSAARNFSTSKARGEKIMIVDADEELAQQSIYLLENYLMNPDWKEYKTLFLKIRNYYKADLKQFTEMLQPRVFENDGKPIYEGSIHNKPRAMAAYLFAPDVILNHYGYQFEGKPELYKKKNRDRTLPMLVEKYEADSEDIHTLTHLAKTHYVMENHEGVVEIGEKWMKRMAETKVDEGWFAFFEVFVNLVASYLVLDRPDDAERVMKEAEKYTGRLLNMYYYLGLYWQSKDEAKAAEFYEKCVTIASEEGSLYELLVSNNTLIILPQVLNWLAAYYYGRGEYIKAGNCVNEGIRINENRVPLAWDIWNHPDVQGKAPGESCHADERTGE